MRPRIRSVKPEILSDERLWDLGTSTGLPVLQGFIGLWCYADREGRFEWRPRALKTMVLPYWDGDFGPLLEALEAERYVVRYVVNGKEYGYVRNFAKHQRVNHREEPSIIPAPPVSDPCPTNPEPCTTNPEASTDSVSPARGEGSWKGREGKGKGAGETQASTATPPPPTSGQTRTGPVAADGVPVTWQSLRGWDPPPELEAEAVMANVSREYFRIRVARAKNQPIGGARGVFDRADWVRSQFGYWAVDQRTEAAKQAPKAARGAARDAEIAAMKAEALEGKP